MSLDPTTRWRLILGEAADSACAGAGGRLSGEAAAMDRALDWLYGRAGTERGVRRQGGRAGSTLTVPDWIDVVHTLFPKETIERLERDAIEIYVIDDVITKPEVLARAELNETLLKAVLRTKHLMAPDVLVMARKLVQEVVRRFMDALARDLAVAFGGVLDRRRHTRLPGTLDGDAFEAGLGGPASAELKRLLAAGLTVGLDHGPVPVARLPTANVRFLVPGAVGHARCDCAAVGACAHVTVAIRAFRDAAGSPEVRLGARSPVRPRGSRAAGRRGPRSPEPTPSQALLHDLHHGLDPILEIRDVGEGPPGQG